MYDLEVILHRLGSTQKWVRSKGIHPLISRSAFLMLVEWDRVAALSSGKVGVKELDEFDELIRHFAYLVGRSPLDDEYAAMLERVLEELRKDRPSLGDGGRSKGKEPYQ